MLLGNYQLIHQLHESSLSRVYRGRRNDGLEVIVKMPAAMVTGQEFDTRARHELLVCRMCDASPNVISALELVEERGVAALVFESIPGAMSLAERGRDRALSIRESVAVALGILDALAGLHARNIVHKDIKPDNVLVTLDLTRVVLIDLGIAAIVPRDASIVPTSAKLEGSLRFMPPEQTGRVNRSVDYRSDYYTLGATLYWMLAGEAPFASLSDPHQLVHAHIALAPVLLHERDPRIPLTLAKLVGKLLSKSADDRYQGSYGLRADLERCLEQLDGGPDFELGVVDRSERLTIPRRLYGRENEQSALAELYLDLDDGPFFQVLRGPMGAGKTALLDGFRSSLGGEVIYASGKFEALVDSEPYGAVGAAVRGVVGQLSMDPQARRQVMTRIYARVGSNVSLLFDVFPELAQLLGVPLRSLNTTPESPDRERVWETLDGVLDALFLPARDYVLFIDDLHWGDEASLRLLEHLCDQPERRVLVLAAVRELETPAPMFEAWLERMPQRPVMELEPLGLEAVRALIGDALSQAPAAGELAEIIWQRSKGIPLFVGQLLHAMYVDGVVAFERSTGEWLVDLNGVRESELTVDTAEYLARRFARLDAETRAVLAIAACVGPSFDLETLSAVAGARLDVEGGLGVAVRAGYVSSTVLPVAAESHLATASSLRYRFAHDHLRRVALTHGSGEPAALHLAIARVLCATSTGEAQGHEERGHLAEHIALARELVVEDDECVRFAAICRRAGSRARRAGAHELAIPQLETAASLLESAARTQWQPRSDLLEVCFEYGECLYASGRLDAARRAFARARSLVETRHEKVSLLLALARLMRARGQETQTLALALEAAAAFGHKLELDAGVHELDARLAALHGELEDYTAEELVTRPALEDEELRSLVELLQTVTHSASLSGHSNRIEVLLSLCVELGLTHGFCSTTGLCFVQLASLEVTQGGDNARARRYASIGLAIVERFPNSPALAEAQMIYGWTLHPWFEPLASSLAPLDTAARQLRNAGMMATAQLASAARIVHELLVGAPLDQVLADSERARAARSNGARHAHDELLRALQATASALASEQPSPSGLEGEDESEGQDEDELPPSPVSTFIAHTIRAFAHVLLGWREQAARSLEQAEQLAHVAAPPLAQSLFEFVAGLDACERYPEAEDTQRTRLVARIDSAMNALARWEASCPVNAQPYARLLHGAWAMARGDGAAAIDAYTLAADLAQCSGAFNLEACANERAANILIAQGKRRAAVGYFEDAYQAYGRWGAVALQRRIDEQLRRGGGKSNAIATFESVTMDALDLSGALEMAQVMFDATTLEEVIDRLLQAANESAGATRCLLLLDDRGKLRIRAERRATGELYLLDHGVSLTGAGTLLSLSVLRACVNSRTPVIVDDASRDPRYAIDPYVLAQGMRALLAVPLLRQSQRVGILYLENDMTPGAFTPGHLALLATLAAQAAISIDNARLFDALRQRDEQWRAVASNAPDFILIVNRRRCVEYMNRYAYGLSPELIIGEPATFIVTQSDRALVDQAIEYVFETGHATSCEARIQTPDDAGVRHWSIRVGPIMRDENVERVTLISTDKTDQMQLEQQLQHSQKLQAVGTLAGGVAHDFNNLLTVIMGACEITRLHSSDATVLEMLEEIDTAASQAAGLTHQLLAFSRKQVLQPRCFDLREQVNDLSKLFQRVLGETVELQMVLGEEPCMIFADRGQISQVLVNLAVNARDAMFEGGTLTMTTTRVSRESEGEDSASYDVLLEVADTGHGMESEVLERIFEPFFTTKPEGKGTGLGMATVLGIVGQSGGSIEVYSAPGQGTTFIISLPFAEGEADPEAERVDDLPRGGEQVLLVEDELAVQRVSARMLELQGYSVHIAANGEQALALARSIEHLDLLITDVVMPGMSGREVADAVTELWPEVRVLYTSGYTDDAVMHHGVLDGTRAYLPKPFARELLARAVRDALDRDPNATPGKSGPLS